MYEFHAWVGLSDSTDEDDRERVGVVVERMRNLIRGSSWPDATFRIDSMNGQFFLVADGLLNRYRDEGRMLDQLLLIVVEDLPGSWGIVYERDDEMPVPPGPNAYRVRVLSRGRMEVRLDPFLSPCIPTIED